MTDALFADSDFFDPHDLLQVKYEMLRRVRSDDVTVSQAARLFGFSRPSFYHARGAFTRGGLGALVPEKRGPRRAHKLSQKVVAFLERTIAADPGADLVAAVQQEFGLSVHRRSIEPGVGAREKKTTLATSGQDGVGGGRPRAGQRYEDLRRHVISHAGGHRLGLALFQREGMKAWLDAWSTCTTREARPLRDGSDDPDRVSPLPLTDDVGAIVRLVASMAMATLQDVSIVNSGQQPRGLSS